MTTFALISEESNEKIFEKIQLIYPGDDSKRFGENLIFIHSDNDVLAEQVNKKIIGEDNLDGHELKIGRFVILSISSYYGWHDVEMWDWLQEKGV